MGLPFGTQGANPSVPHLWKGDTGVALTQSLLCCRQHSFILVLTKITIPLILFGVRKVIGGWHALSTGFILENSPKEVPRDFPFGQFRIH